MAKTSTISKAELKSMQKMFKTDAAIGAKFGVTRQAICQLRQKYGITAMENKNRNRDRDILAMHKRKVKVSQIAENFGLSPSRVYSVLRNR